MLLKDIHSPLQLAPALTLLNWDCVEWARHPAASTNQEHKTRHMYIQPTSHSDKTFFADKKPTAVADSHTYAGKEWPLQKHEKVLELRMVYSTASKKCRKHKGGAV